jgi:hypothetical protein
LTGWSSRAGDIPPMSVVCYIQCHKYHFGEYIIKGLERNLLEILGKILKDISKHKLGLKDMEKLGNIGKLKNSEKMRNIRRNQRYFQHWNVHPLKQQSIMAVKSSGHGIFCCKTVSHLLLGAG